MKAMTVEWRDRNLKRRLLLSVVLIFSLVTVSAQQYNSDSWLSKQHGVITIIPTWGQRNSMLMTTFSLFPRWEFTVAAYMYNNDGDPRTDDGFSSTIYAKYMIYENKAKTGGIAAKAGTGLFPGTLEGEDRAKDAFQTFWMNFPATIPLFKNKVSWDLMPGVSMTKNYGPQETTAWNFTYSTRLAWYAFGPELAVVGEVFGSRGQAESIPEYKVGLRWEPTQHFVLAGTYGQEFSGTNGAGFEIGIMIFTPPFACIGGCDPNKKNKKFFGIF